MRELLLCCLRIFNFYEPTVEVRDHHEERVIGSGVSEQDRRTWHIISSPAEVEEEEVIAVRRWNQWVYGRVIAVPFIETFVGFANIDQEMPYYRNFATNFKRDARKLVVQDEKKADRELHELKKRSKTN